MQKVQVQAEIDVKSFLSQLGTKELEEFLRETAALLTRRKVGDKKAKEAVLLRQLNEECALPEAHWLRFHVLDSKRQAGGLTPKESEELFRLIKEEEQLRLRRILILGELAQLRGIPLPEIAAELGIKAPDYAD
jgi:hypothetical protein